MPNLAKVIKDEISRLARKEVRAAQAAMRKETARLRKANTDLRNRVATLEKAAKHLSTTVEAVAPPAAPAPEPAGKQRISGKGVRSLRARLKLTREQFGQLCNATGQSVFNWEKQNGVLALRSRTRDALIGLRGIGIKEAKARLEAMDVAKLAASKKTTKKRIAKKG